MKNKYCKQVLAVILAATMIFASEMPAVASAFLYIPAVQ